MAPAALRSGLALAMAVLGFVACAAPDTPARLESETPDSVLALLRPDTVRAAALHPAVGYRYLWSPEGPWAVHLVDVRLADRCDLSLHVLRPRAREAGGRGRERVSQMAVRATGVLAAVNADFFTPEGATVGTEIVGGVVTAVADRPTFSWRRGSEPWMGPARRDGDVVRVGWPVPLDSDAPGATPTGRAEDGARTGATGEPTGAIGEPTQAVGGFPDLIDGGRRVGDLEVAARPSFAAARHPRTAVGYDVDSGRLWLVVVDGRQPPHSAGMTLPELSVLLEALGVEEALNLDGGGSSALVVGAGPVNRPSDATGERAVVNALALVRTPEACRGLSSPR